MMSSWSVQFPFKVILFCHAVIIGEVFNFVTEMEQKMLHFKTLGFANKLF